MDIIQHFNRLFVYNDWANRETLASLKKPGTPPPRTLKFMAHIIAAEWLWLSRLKADENKVVVWPELTLDHCGAHLTDLWRAWREYLDDLTPARLSETVAYTNSLAESWTSKVEDIVLHVIMHSAYHRGQIASELRAAGYPPAYTDFIHSVRQGFVE